MNKEKIMDIENTKDTENDTENDTFSDKQIFKMALVARDFEIKMFWQRCNYFLLLNSSVGAAIAVVLINDKTIEKVLSNVAAASMVSDEKVKYLILFLCFIGMFVCFAWIKVGLGAKFWQVYWEQVVADFQGSTGLSSSEEKNIFSDYDAIKWRVEKAFKGKFDCYNIFVLAKPSVSRWMHRTACFFFGVWLAAFVYNLYHIFCS